MPSRPGDGPLAPHRLAGKVADHPAVAYEAKLAESAPPALVAFIFYMTRDLIPPRYTESVIAHIMRDGAKVGDSELWQYADRIARQLSYEPQSGDSPEQATG